MNRYLPSYLTLTAVCRNSLITIALLCMLVFGRPGAPDCLREVMYPVAKILGISQNNWTMFGPEVGTENRRLGAKIHYQDGTVSEWSSPVWREQNLWERMMTHRLSKYVEVIQSPNQEAAWPALADFIIASDQRAHGHHKAPEKIDIRVFRGSILDARLSYWKPFSDPTPMDDRYSMYTKDFESPTENASPKDTE